MKKKLRLAKTNVPIATGFQDAARTASVLSAMDNVWMILASWIYVLREAVAELRRRTLPKATHANASPTLASTATAAPKKRRCAPIIGGVDRSVGPVNATCHKASTSRARWTPESAAAKPTITSKAEDVIVVIATLTARIRLSATQRRVPVLAWRVSMVKSATNAHTVLLN